MLLIAIMLISTTALVSNAQTTPQPSLNANYIAQTLGTQMVITNNQTGVVTAVLVRQAPSIKIANQTPANNFTLMNSVVEFMLIPGSSNNETVYARGFFGLLENEVNPVIKQAINSNLTLLNLHPFAIQDQPKLQFLHWETRGNLSTILTNIKGIIGNTSIGSTPAVKPQIALNATDIGAKLNGTVVNGSVVDVMIPRQDVNITELMNPDIALNSFASMSTSFEFMASNTSSTNTNTTGTNVTVMGDFALKETELGGVETVLMNSSSGISNVTITAIHDHTLMETPQMVFLHFMMTGELNQTINLLNQALNKTSTRANATGPSPSTSPSASPTYTPTNTTTITSQNQTGKINSTLVSQMLGTQILMTDNKTGVLAAVLIRQSPQVMLENGTISAANFTLLNSIVEFQIPAGSTDNQTVYARGIFGLLESEIAPVIRQAITSNITVLNLHPFAIGDVPKLQFLHWETKGNLTAVLTALKGIIGNTSIGQTPAAKPQTALNASYIGSKINGTIINGSVVDVIITRKDVNVSEAAYTGINLNEFASMSTSFEFMAMNFTSGSNSTGGTNNTQNVVVMGDFALKESELAAVEKILLNSTLTNSSSTNSSATSIKNVTITAIHSHTLMETPKMVFLHFMMTGELNQTITTLNQALNATSTAGITTPSGTNATASPSPSTSTSTSPSPSSSSSSSGTSGSPTAKPSSTSSSNPSPSPTVPELSTITTVLALLLLAAVASVIALRKNKH